jgi:hypothetical protein
MEYLASRNFKNLHVFITFFSGRRGRKLPQRPSHKGSTQCNFGDTSKTKKNKATKPTINNEIDGNLQCVLSSLKWSLTFIRSLVRLLDFENCQFNKVAQLLNSSIGWQRGVKSRPSVLDIVTTTEISDKLRHVTWLESARWRASVESTGDVMPFIKDSSSL